MIAAFAPNAVTTADLELAASLLGIDANQVRVAVSRLRAQGKIESKGRGVYRLSQAVLLRQTALGPWRTRLERLVEPWDGSYFVALTSWLPKSDRKAARNRGRALTRLGFREHRHGVAVRPANLDLDREGMESVLKRLGFDDQGELLLAKELGFDARPLWPEQPPYAERARELERGLSELRRDASVDGAVESFRVANECIRDAVRDPLLPAAWTDAAARQSFWRALVDYDGFGRTLWMKNVWDRVSVSEPGPRAPRASAHGA